jgi:nucleolin
MSSASSDLTESTVYVDGLPYTASEDDIRSFFAAGKCGKILEIRAPKYQDTGRLRGYAHIRFQSNADAHKALSLDGKYLKDRFLSIQLAKAPSSIHSNPNAPRPEGCVTVFVKGLPYETNEAAVRACFQRFGDVASVRLPRWNHTGRLKGNGYVQFAHGFSADAAMKASLQEGLSVEGRRVQLDWETGAPRQSFKDSSGQAFYKTKEAASVKAAIAKELKAKEKEPGVISSRESKKRSRDTNDDDNDDGDENEEVVKVKAKKDKKEKKKRRDDDSE